MAMLTEQERAEFIRVSKAPAWPRVSPPCVPPRDFLRALSSLTRFTALSHIIPSPKPARFSGNHWKL